MHEAVARGARARSCGRALRRSSPPRAPGRTPRSVRPSRSRRQLQLFTLAVPTEKEDATTTKIELTPPRASRSTRSCPRRGWKRDVQQTGSGEEAVIQKVTWTGGNVPTEEDAVFQFLASADASKTLHVRGPADLLGRLGRRLDAARSPRTRPAPTIEAKSVARRRRRARPSRSSRSSSADSRSCSRSSRSSPAREAAALA